MNFVGSPLLRSEPDGCLWNGANEQNAQSAVKSHEASLLHRLSSTVYHTIILWRVRLFVQLELRLHILGGIRDANFNSSSDAASQNVLPHIFRLSFRPGGGSVIFRWVVTKMRNDIPSVTHFVRFFCPALCAKSAGGCFFLSRWSFWCFCLFGRIQSE